MGTGEGVVVLVVAADRGAQAFGQLFGSLDGIAQNDARAVQDDRELGGGEQLGRFSDGFGTAGGTLEAKDAGCIRIPADGCDRLYQELERELKDL